MSDTTTRTPFTPGPWKVEPWATRGLYDVKAGTQTIAPRVTNAADACLIAAAPEMYAALREILDTLAYMEGRPTITDEAHEMAFRAARKALGLEEAVR